MFLTWKFSNLGLLQWRLVDVLRDLDHRLDSFVGGGVLRGSRGCGSAERMFVHLAHLGAKHQSHKIPRSLAMFTTIVAPLPVVYDEKPSITTLKCSIVTLRIF